MKIRRGGALEDQPVSQVTSPWVVSGTVDIGATPEVEVTLNGEVVPAAQSGAWTVSVDNFPTDYATETTLSDTKDSILKNSEYWQWYSLLSVSAKITEEVKRDPGTGVVYSYHGRAVSGSADSDSVWEVMRFEFTTALKIELVGVRMRTDIRWDQRTVGW